MLPDSRARFEPATLLQLLEAPQSNRDRCGDERDRCELVGYDSAHHLDLGELGEGSSWPPGAIPWLAYGGGLGLPSRPLKVSPGGQQSSNKPKLATSPLAEVGHSHAVVCSYRVIPEGRSRGCVRGSGTCTTHPSRVEYAV
jgi:hypothetical protein